MSSCRCHDCGEAVNLFCVTCPECGGSDLRFGVLPQDAIEAYVRAAGLYEVA
jgi:hypothetical protein